MILKSQSIWSANNRRGSASNVLAREVRAIVPTGITTLIVGDDISGTSIDAIPARIGSNATPVSTARATRSTLNGRGAGRWATDANGMGYSLATGQLTQLVVATWDGPATFPSFCGLVGGQTAGSRILGQSGTSNILSEATIYRDGVASVAVDALPHIWESSSASGSASSRQLGGSDGAAVNNWHGLIAFCLQLSIQLSAPQRAALTAVLKSYYSIA